MILTSKYKLKKPEYKDNADIAVLNENMDLLENALLKLQSQINSVKTTADKIYKQTPYTNKVIFDASGTWTVPAGVSKAAFWIQDGGSGSSGISYKDSTLGWHNSIYVPDASSGAWTVIYDINTEENTVVAVTVGTGGLGGVASGSMESHEFKGQIGGKSNVKINQTTYAANDNNILGQYLESKVQTGSIAGGKVAEVSLTGSEECKYELSQLTPALKNGGQGQFRDQNINGSSDLVLSNGKNGTSGKVIIYF